MGLFSSKKKNTTSLPYPNYFEKAISKPQLQTRRQNQQTQNLERTIFNYTCAPIRPKVKNVLEENRFPSDFHLLSTIPSELEIISEKPFILPAIIDKPYANINDYLNTQFRLLKEDTFRGLRTCLSDYSYGRDLKNGKIYQNAYLLKIEHSLAGKLWYFVVPVLEEIHWKSTKCLESGSLVCLSCDNFKSFYFASIYSRKDDGRNGKLCILILSFQSKTEPKYFSHLFDIIESTAYFESYYYAAENLKKMHKINFPLGNSFINFTGCNLPPFSFNAMQKMEIIKFKRKIGEETQSQAFELALNNKVALIQGPPGTGKSYLGSQIARFLIDIANIQKPLIIMCYTNHALDQFLEKLLIFSEKIIRMGGGCKSEMLRPYNLKSLSESIRMKAKEAKNKVYENDENDIIEKSYDIVKNMCGGNMHLINNTSNPLYGQVKNRMKIWNEELDQYITRMHPFKKCDKNTTLGDVCDMSETYFEEKVGKSVFSTFKFSKSVKIHQWLMTEPPSCFVYNDMSKFNEILIEEISNAIKLNALKLQNISNKNDENLENKTLTNLLIRLCTNLRLTTEKLKEFKTFINMHLDSTETAFPLFLRTATRYMKKYNIKLPSTCTNLNQLKLIERWGILMVVNEAVLQNKIKLCKQGICIQPETKNYFNAMGHSQTLKPLCNFDLKNHNAQIDILKSLFADRDINLLRYADVIGITTSGAAKNFDILKSLKPTTFIIEEAAEVLESHVVAALTPNIKHLILIGDHFQLKPLPNEYDLATNYKLEVSLFERLFNNNVPSKCLRVQHRMRPSISGLLVPEFYDNLDNHPTVWEFENIVGVSSNIFFIQHSEMENRVDKLKSHSNSYESTFIIGFCEYLVSQGHEPKSITILTTYAGQLHLIKNQINNKICLDGVLATTVDGYQGEENDIVLISFVRSNSQNNVGFIKTKNRICVALSRARKGLYCFGNFEMFSRRSETWRSLLTKLMKMNCFGEEIQIYCPHHPEKRFNVKTPRDFQRNYCNLCIVNRNQHDFYREKKWSKL